MGGWGAVGSHPPLSFSPTCSRHPFLSSFLPTPGPQLLCLGTLLNVPVGPRLTRCPTWASAFLALGSVSPSAQQEGGRAPGSPLIHHCHRHPSMEHALIEEEEGADGEGSHLQGTNCVPSSAPSGTQSSPFAHKEAEAERYGDSPKDNSQWVTLDLSMTCSLSWLAPTCCAWGPGISAVG